MKKPLVLLLSMAFVTGASPSFAQGSAPAERHAYFGDLHLHTTMSYDAWMFGTGVTPDQAYKFAKGQTIMVPASQVQQEEGLQAGRDVPAKRAWPLDFTAVTDHAEMLGAMHQLDDPNSTFAKSDLGQKAIKNRRTVQPLIMQGFSLSKGPKTLPAEMTVMEAARNGWVLEMKAANDNYEPGKFTTFIAYEWTADKKGRTLHHNVIFNADHAPTPFTASNSTSMEDLWTYLESVRAQGIDVISIPHNANLSGGMEYDWNDSSGKPIDEAYAQRRALNEPLTEILQTRGQSDTTPELSPNDEFANFEIFDKVLPGDTSPTARAGSTVRDAYGRGLIIQSKVGANPYKFGVVGGTDIHNGMTSQDENSTAGGAYGIDPNTMLPSGRVAQFALGGQGANFLQYSSGGMTGVWAETNTRDSIFAALKRKETFATSGVRMRVRMFAGWNFDPKMTNSMDWPTTAYISGVPMGADMPARPAGSPAPKLALWAVKDPDGANLDRIQVIKIWLEGSSYKEKIFDVALSDNRKSDSRTGKTPAVGNTVNTATGTYSNKIGATELKTVWQDPEFDPAKPVVYYARVLQIPTARWSTLLAIKNHMPLPTAATATIQERGWSSPIWYTPAKS